MTKAGEIPYSWERIEGEIRYAILAQADMLGAFGPWCDGDIVKAYLGVTFEETSYHDMTKEQIASIDITRHQLYRHVREAYDYAYQLDGADEAHSTIWHDTDGLLQGFPETDSQGEPSPFCTLSDFPLRRVLETFFARWALHEEGWDMTTRQLALLSNMTVPAVRTSLSKEGYKLYKSQGRSRSRLEDAGFKLPANDALAWLSGRRGYIPNRSAAETDPRAAISEVLRDSPGEFPATLRRIMEIAGQETEGLAQSQEVDRVWLEALIAGEAAAPDVDALRKIARGVKAPEPEFVAAAVQHLLSQELSN